MVKPIFGAAGLSDSAGFNTHEIRTEILDILLENGITNLDSARLYTGSEVAIGALEKRTQFTIDTKLIGSNVGCALDKESVIRDTADSLDRVKIKQFDIMYLHAPDPATPFEETHAGINEAYKKGIFRRFGLSNFTAEQVQEFHDIAEKNGWVKPSVYQGNYSAVARNYDDILLPTLKKLGIKFYAYSPIAGGFLTKTAEDLDAGKGRFNKEAIGGLYQRMYDNPTMREALVQWNKIAEKEGVSKAELAYRWVIFHSAISKDDENGVIFGASSKEQIKETASFFKKGPLSKEAVQSIDDVWAKVKSVAPIDNFSHFKK